MAKKNTLIKSKLEDLNGSFSMKEVKEFVCNTDYRLKLNVSDRQLWMLLRPYKIDEELYRFPKMIISQGVKRE